jgi:hypothetical protein
MNLKNRSWLPPLAEIFGGLLLGAVIGVPLTFVIPMFIQPRSGSFDDVVGALAGLYFGYIIGVVIGVTLAGRWMKHHGAWWMALIGAVAGALLAIGLASLGLANQPALVQVAYFGLTVILAVVAYTWSASRREKREPEPTA